MIESEDKGTILIALARQAIADQLDIGHDPINANNSWLKKTAATFVTLTQHGKLRGCIGTLEAYRPLIEDVQANAIAAAFHDSRFTPLSQREYGSLNIELSLLSAMQAVEAKNEQLAMANIRPEIDGVVLQYRKYKATFLPQVWDQLPDPQQFMAHLKQKAGLTANFWDTDIQLFTYQVDKFHE